MAPQALAGLKVVEYGQFISAPECAKRLGGLGAEVIKVEEPGIGDEARRYGPFPNDVPHPERSGLFLNLNTNKLGITLNLRVATGQKIFKDLIKDADILVENNPPSLMEELGIDYSSLREVNERLIMTSITPYGQTGPYRDYKGYDLNIQTFTGVPNSRGSPDREGLVDPLCLGDFQGGLSGAAATMVALFGRELTGRGQQVDVSTTQALTTLHGAGGATAWRLTARARMTRGGHRSGGGRWPYGVYPCKDGYMSIMSLEDAHWDRFVELMGNPEWAKDPRFADGASRGQHADELDAYLIGLLADYTREELFDICLRNRISYIPVYDAGEVVEGEQLKAREWFVEIDHPETGVLKYPGAPAKLSKTPWAITRRAPLLGEHNEEVLCQRLGYSKEDLVEMRRTGVI